MTGSIKTIEGKLDATGLKFTLLASRWNHFINDRLVEGAIDTLVRHGVAESDIQIVRCPGSFEIPAVLAQLVKNPQTAGDGIVCLATLIRGDTPHFDYISAEVTKGIASIALYVNIPITYGVLTCETVEQAIHRAGTKAGNKGGEAALAAIEMARLYREIGKAQG
jgi:6,7-dimethyl-8-ribityllumazine synthase